MLSQFFVTILLFILVRARAIVTNECEYNVWIWSIPLVGSSHTENVPIKPGGQYQEPWRLGTSETPGVAIKVSNRENGIDVLAEEINFAYRISNEDRSKIWVDLSPVRGAHLYNRMSFHSCVPEHTAASVEPHVCNAKDEVELVLCGTDRTIPATDNASLEQIQACYQLNSGGSEVSGSQAEYHGSSDALSTGFDTGGSEERVQDSPSMLRAHCGHHWYDCSVYDKDPVNEESPYYDQVPVVSRCQAKVVYSGRRNVRTSPTPLSMGNAPMTRREQQARLCEIIERYHPEVKECDEEEMKAHARAMYPHLCEPVYEPLLMGFPCEDIAKELRSVYPGVTNTAKVTEEHDDSECECNSNDDSECLCDSDTETGEDSQEMLPRCPDDRECLSNFCEPTLPGVKCAYIAKKLKAAAKSFGVDYKDVINDDMEACPLTPKTTLDGRPIVCIAKLYTRLDMATECESMQTLLKHTAKVKLDQDIEFSTDEVVCGN